MKMLTGLLSRRSAGVAACVFSTALWSRGENYGKSCGEERNTSLCPLHICGSTALFRDSLLQATVCVGLHFGPGMMISTELNFAAAKLKQFSSLYASVKLSLSGHIFLLERSFTDDCIFCVLCDGK